MSEIEVYRRQGLGSRVGFGKKAALVIVDFTNGFNDPNVFGGGNIGEAVEHTRGLLEAARRHGLPVAHTRVIYADDAANAGVFTMKSPRLKELTKSNPMSQIVPALTPRAGELIVDKTEASGFFGTGLAAWLALRRVDTLVVAGCTTSGCVRATVVDACSHNLRPIVPRDCVGDRALGPHEASLFDMDQKYADVMSSNEVLDALARLEH
ncbi:MAG: isochorismatase family protein [Alphaproteobacteria bacterium]|nr:isochorismatase family protein [Alphaproteobacteria bacterium]